MSAPQKTFGGRLFSFGMMPPTDAIRVEVSLVKAIGEPLLRAFIKAQEISKDQKFANLAELKSNPEVLDTVSKAMGTISARMDAEDLLKTMGLVFDRIVCNGQPINIDATFVGRNKELWQVFMEGLRVNFADFFPDGLSLSPPGDPPAA